MNILNHLLYIVNKSFEKIEKSIIILTSFFLTLLTILAICNRYFLKYSMAWYEEVAIILYMILVYWGASNVERKNSHLRLVILPDMLKGKKIAIYLDLFTELICLIVSIMGTFFAIKMSSLTMMKTVTLGIPNSIVLLSSLAIGFLGLTLTYLYKFLTSLTKCLKKN